MTLDDSNRRSFCRKLLFGGALVPGLGGTATARNFNAEPPKKPGDAFRILHFTDIHLRPEHQAPERFARMMRSAFEACGRPDLIFNGGDSIYAADYGHITRERVLEQWKLWDEVVVPAWQGLDVIHALGNHDMWWAGGEKDPMYGKPYVLERLGQKRRFLGIDRAGWRLLVLDANNPGLIDREQEQWLSEEVKQHADKPLAVLSHQPVMMGEHLLGKGMSRRQKQLVNPLVDRRVEARPVHFISGHIHVLDSLSYANVNFHCNGAASGSWWETDDSPDCSYKGTPMGYAVIDLWPDGRFETHYHNETDAEGGRIKVR